MRNLSPRILDVTKVIKRDDFLDLNRKEREPIDTLEIFDLIRSIRDPEHPFSLEQLGVVSTENINVSDEHSKLSISFTPTIPHCGMVTLIGLTIKAKLIRCLPSRFKVDLFVTPGSHISEIEVNKQLNDKERVAAALENTEITSVINKCIR